MMCRKCSWVALEWKVRRTHWPHFTPCPDCALHRSGVPLSGITIFCSWKLPCWIRKSFEIRFPTPHLSLHHLTVDSWDFESSLSRNRNYKSLLENGWASSWSGAQTLANQLYPEPHDLPLTARGFLWLMWFMGWWLQKVAWAKLLFLTVSKVCFFFKKNALSALQGIRSLTHSVRMLLTHLLGSATILSVGGTASERQVAFLSL